jgi:hypothetical protein
MGILAVRQDRSQSTSVVAIDVEIEVAGKLWETHFQVTEPTAFAAAVLREKIQATIDRETSDRKAEVVEAYRDGYKEGWKDAKAKNAKQY